MVIFMNIKDLGDTHSYFYKEILESVTGKSRKRIGEVFVDYKNWFLSYGEYCAQLPKATQLLDMLVSMDDRGGGEQVQEGGGEVQAGGPSDGAEAGGPDPGPLSLVH